MHCAMRAVNKRLQVLVVIFVTLVWRPIQSEECSSSLKFKYLKGERDEKNCGYDVLQPGCRPGFFVRNDSILPCSEGWFCPQDFACEIECFEGSFCPRATLEGTRCQPYQELPYEEEGTGLKVCGGAFNVSLCPTSFYCPDATTKLICPEGNFCPEGSHKPKNCLLFSRCPEGTVNPTSWGITVLVLALFVLLPLISFHIYRYLRDKRRIQNDDQLEDIRQSIMNEDSIEGKDRILSTLNFGLLSPVRSSIRSRSSSRRSSYLPSDVKSRIQRMDIEFRNLSLTLRSSKKVVLQNCTGSFRNGRMAAIMGPSGCGKTSLLNVLAHRAEYGHITGNLVVNGQTQDTKENQELLDPWVGFVPQEDIMHSEFTVKETLMFYANLRLPTYECSLSRQLIVQQVMKVLGLYEIRHSRIGGADGERGISGGQRKRVNIGMELVANPSLLFLDEPTSGLDSTSCLEVVEALRRISKNGVNVIVVLHQPRTEVYKLFDDICLLLDGGYMAYHGPRDSVLPYFQDIGHQCPVDCNPADFLLDVVSYHSKDEATSTDLNELWTRKHADFLPSDDSQLEFGTTPHHHVVPKLETLIPLRPRPGMVLQFWYFFRRGFVQLMRSPITQILDFGLVSVAGLGLGLLFHTRTIDDLTTIALLISMSIGMTTMLSSVRLFGNERVTFHRERGMGVNPVSYFLGKNIASAYMHLLSPLFFLISYYALVVPNTSFVEFYGTIYAATLACSGLSQLVSLVFNKKNMQLAGVVLILLLNMVSGTNPTVCRLNDTNFLTRMGVHISYARYFVDALVVFELRGFSPVYKYFVDDIISTYCFDEYGIPWDIFILVLAAIGLRLCAFIALIVIVPNRHQSWENASKVGLIIFVGLVISGAITAAIVGIGYLVINQVS